MSAATGVGPTGRGARVPWVDVVMSAVAAVSWALIGMAGTAAIGLRLLDADAAGSLGPMTAAVVALGAGGSVTPSGDMSAFGLSGAEAGTAMVVTPLGVSLVGALLLSYFFLRSLRASGVVVSGAELLARAGAVAALFVAMAGGLVWAGHDVVTIDGSALGLGGGLEIPGLGDVGGLLPDRVGDLVDAEAAVGFTVDTVPTLLGGLGWATGVLLVALLASRRTPLPRGWGAVHRVVRPVVSALVTVALVAVAAGGAAAAYAAIGDEHPRRIAGAALLGAPNGVWTGVPLGLFVPWDGRASGALLEVLPHPVDELLRAGSDRSVTLGRLAEYDGRVWLLAVAAALMMLLAGVLTAVRTPVTAAAEAGPVAFAGRCALGLGVATALTLPLLAWLTEVSANASLSVLGFDAFDAGIELHGRLGMALLLGAVWGAGAGAAGALLAWASGAAGARAARPARGDMEAEGAWRAAGRVEGPPWTGPAGPYEPGLPHRPPNPDTNPYLRVGRGPRGVEEPAWRPEGRRGASARSPGGAQEMPGPRGAGGARGPQGAHGPEDAVPAPGAREPGSPEAGGAAEGAADGRGDVYGAPTVIGPIEPRRGRGWPEKPPPPADPPPVPRKPDRS
ncbi:streptophobe family protein [Streptomyces edwardsiae]|uniref:Streptophobe family protein n=1 Tax=Streptomyces edwardsiae TaxID=3075527 RepID=A0ABU2Q526_9ACTN|nr:streptophobe family protein [Streptomyces sp. DSM 41636]MDT0399142.1 streptophobe family protein [Streptomyces sp. DSM 41636]